MKAMSVTYAPAPVTSRPPTAALGPDGKPKVSDAKIALILAKYGKVWPVKAS